MRKTLANINDKQEIVRRLGILSPESPRRWGKMTAHQMICHLADSFRGPMGKIPLSMAPSRLPRRFVKLMALYVFVPWPKGVPTRPEMDQQKHGTPPSEFNADRNELLKLLDEFSMSTRAFTWGKHPMFGSLSDAEWMRWGYLHMDHHLRQFGV